MIDNEWLTVDEAAEKSGYHPNHIRRLIRKGEIDAKKFGSVWAINKESLFDHLNRMQERGEKRGPKTENKLFKS